MIRQKKLLSFKLDVIDEKLLFEYLLTIKKKKLILEVIN